MIPQEFLFLISACVITSSEEDSQDNDATYPVQAIPLSAADISTISKGSMLIDATINAVQQMLKKVSCES